MWEGKRMKKITFMLEYGCIPIWVNSEKGELLCVGLPEDLEEHTELAELLEEIWKEYDALFINNSVEFSYRGFLTKEDEKRFDQKVFRAIDMLKEVAKGKYEIEVVYNVER